MINRQLTGNDCEISSTIYIYNFILIFHFAWDLSCGEWGSSIKMGVTTCLILSYIVTKNFVCKIINIRHKKEK